jgi:ankyrin repeat protein
LGFKIYGDSIPWTLLQFACALGNQKSIDVLLLAGADTNVKDSTGRTAQDIADFLKKNVKL